ncbi:hypothetical protein BN2476_250123 [Paraburkholderia piptadeniae]|uniref:Uncharacterized protein n=1 Tax=Paraburkholderia piptadeniae TaxID=1701573 RepID=A0A1N7S1N9_9BURK|nr:hypothetical protein BN2476_250123 [Paraburkholderia piptadeniae]
MNAHTSAGRRVAVKNEKFHIAAYDTKVRRGRVHRQMRQRAVAVLRTRKPRLWRCSKWTMFSSMPPR